MPSPFLFPQLGNSSTLMQFQRISFKQNKALVFGYLLSVQNLAFLVASMAYG
jgi:hypothetical protein